MDALEKEKLVVPGTRVELARALVGIAVRDGTPVPNIATPDALKQRLMSARAVAYIDPKIGGQAGATIVALLKGMGISDEVAKKSVFGNTGAEAVQKMVNGDADIAISFVSEIMPIKGAKLVGPLPAAIKIRRLRRPSASTVQSRSGARCSGDEQCRGRRVMVQAGLEPIAAK
jgi:molybdate transport system substrate-binding protein